MKCQLSEMIGVGLFLLPPLSDSDYAASFYDDNFFRLNGNRPGQPELVDNLEQTIRDLGLGNIEKFVYEALEKMEDISVSELALDILCFQIIIKCHLSGGCQDNIFAVRGANFVINKSIERWISLHGNIAPVYELPLDALNSRGLIYLSYMNFDLIRARRTYVLLNANRVSGCLEGN